jgi:hypothetical protein
LIFEDEEELSLLSEAVRAKAFVANYGEAFLPRSCVNQAPGIRNDGGMIDVHGVLYGATSNGGGSNCKYYGSEGAGCGTVFALTP